MKKTIWIPIVMGLAAAAIGFLMTYADLTIYVGEFGGIPAGMDFRELFVQLASALGGPLAAIFASLQFWPIFVYLKLPMGLLPVMMAGRLFGGVWTAYMYKLLHERVKNMLLFTLGWAGIVAGYYFIFCAAVDSAIAGLTVEGTFFGTFFTYWWAYLMPPYPPSFIIETTVTWFIGSLIFIALPVHSRRPLWYEPKAATPAEEKA